MSIIGGNMWLLILTISLKSQFNHALDIRTVDHLKSRDQCDNVAKIMIQDLESFNPSIETKHDCINIS